MNHSHFFPARCFFTCIFSVFLSFSGSAQTYVTIPDNGFATYLNQSLPSGCMNGNQLDISNPDVLGNTFMTITTIYHVYSLEGIQYFPSLTYLSVTNNYLTYVPSFPPNLESLYLLDNNLDSLPALPASLRRLSCGANPMTHLPALPNELAELSIYDGLTIALPVPLPDSLQYLYVDLCELETLPVLPDSLVLLSCSGNFLTELPPLPVNLNYLFCHDNQIHCFAPFPETIQTIEADNNPVFCMPNYTASMQPWMLALPLCQQNDPIGNPYNCSAVSGITGTVYIDQSADCQLNTGEETVQGVTVRLADANGDFIALTSSNAAGHYYFPYSNGTYHVETDLTGQPYTSACSTDSTVTLASELIDSVVFAIDCDTSFDLGVSAITATGSVFPGQLHNLSVFAGNMLSFYPFSCLQQVGGTLTLAIEGPVTFFEPGAIAPNQVNGMTFTYEISDFSSIAYNEAFSLVLLTNTTAHSGDHICITATLTTPAGDLYASNNSMEWCYEVGNSYDPNFKEAYPSIVPDQFDGPITYTIHFQNTGTAAAGTIRLSDELDANLDPSTFELLHSSHPVIATIYGDQLSFRFDNIQLPYSDIDEDGSRGFVQYRIRPDAGLPLGTVIENTASIYFDYNAPIVTNTALVRYDATASMTEQPVAPPVVSPNPASGLFQVRFSQPAGEVTVYSLTGKLVFHNNDSGNNLQIDLKDQPSGVYLMKVGNAVRTDYVRLVKL